jgi:hypothetical protein
MNAENKRSDSKIFETRITEFGVVVGKICVFEAWTTILWFFLGLGTSCELFSRNKGSSCKILDHRLTSQKSRSLFARFLN